jgi:hypothetical protein
LIGREGDGDQGLAVPVGFGQEVGGGEQTRSGGAQFMGDAGGEPLLGAQPGLESGRQLVCECDEFTGFARSPEGSDPGVEAAVGDRVRRR